LSEQYTIPWQDVSFIRRTLTIPRSKNGATRHIRLNRSALSALKALQAQGNGSKLVSGGANTPRRRFDPAVKAASLRNFTWHCMRHTFASRLVMAGVDIRTVQELLGHKAIRNDGAIQPPRSRAQSCRRRAAGRPYSAANRHHYRHRGYGAARCFGGHIAVRLLIV
jgi:hypothetical protein